MFLSLENFGNVLKQSAVISVLAMGQLVVILTRGIDLSVGANLSLSAVVGAIVWRDHGSAALSVLATLGTATIVGLVNGSSTSRAACLTRSSRRWRCSPRPAGWRCISSHSKTIQGVPPFVNEIGSGRIASIPGGGARRLVPDRDDRRGPGRRCWWP